MDTRTVDKDSVRSVVWMIDFKLERLETKLISCDEKENVALNSEIDAALIVAPA